jgi:5'-3' exoribonuclease 2
LLQGSTVTGSAAVASSSKDNTKLWHLRLGHMSEKGIQILKKKGYLDNHCTGKVDFCEHCIFGKQRKVSFSKAIHRTKGTLDYIHSDLWGPSRIPSRGKCHYMLTFIDDFSRKLWVYFLKQKNEAFSTFKEWKLLIENQTGKKIKRLRTDNGLEFCSHEFNDFCKKEGITRHFTVTGTPQ